MCSQRNCELSGLEFTIYLSEQQAVKTLIRLLLQKQSDLGLRCLSRPFGWQLVLEISEHLPYTEKVVTQNDQFTDAVVRKYFAQLVHVNWNDAVKVQCKYNGYLNVVSAFKEQFWLAIL